jgi:hypothetical protein
MVLLKRDLPTGKASPGLWGDLTHLFITKSLPLNLQLREKRATNCEVEVGESTLKFKFLSSHLPLAHFLWVKGR